MDYLEIRELYHSSELYHHGIRGQKWGVRRYQNEDGTLTEEGKSRYYNSDGSLTKQGKKESKKYDSKFDKKEIDIYNASSNEFNDKIDAINDKYNKKYPGYNFLEPRNKKEYKVAVEYCTEVGKLFTDAFVKNTEQMVGKNPFAKSTEEYIQNSWAYKFGSIDTSDIDTSHMK